MKPGKQPYLQILANDVLDEGGEEAPLGDGLLLDGRRHHSAQKGVAEGRQQTRQTTHRQGSFFDPRRQLVQVILAKQKRN